MQARDRVAIIAVCGVGSRGPEIEAVDQEVGRAIAPAVQAALGAVAAGHH